MTLFAAQSLLFVHIPKNAGKSVEAAILGLTPNRLRRLGARPFISRAGVAIVRALGKDARRYLHGSLDVTLCAQHMTLQEISTYVQGGRDLIRRNTTFAVVRDPYDRAVSSYLHWRATTRPTAVDFEDFLQSWNDSPAKDHNEYAHRRTQEEYVTDNEGQIATEHLIPMDKLGKGLANLMKMKSLESLSLPHLGSQGTPAIKQELLTKANRALVSSRYEPDLALYERVLYSAGKTGLACF